MRRDFFYVLVLDKDAKTYGLLGPMIDDTSITFDVSEAQRQGRNVTCESQGDPVALGAHAERLGFRRCDFADMGLERVG